MIACLTIANACAWLLVTLFIRALASAPGPQAKPQICATGSQFATFPAPLH